MRLNRHIWPMIALTAVVCLIALFFERFGWIDRSGCTVSLAPTRGMTISSQNPVRVRRGGDAAFAVTFDEGCEHDMSSGLRYENGVLYVDDVTESRTVVYTPRRPCALTVSEADAGSVQLLSDSRAYSGDVAQIRVTPPEHYTARRVLVNDDAYAVPSTGLVSFPVYDDSLISLDLAGEEVTFSVMSDPIGKVTTLQDQDTYRYGDTVTLRCEWDGASARFDGWSTGAYLRNRGTALTTDPELQITLSGDTAVFANLTDLNTYTVTIDPNGGQAGAPIVLSGLSAGKPVDLPCDDGALTRDGYALIGYNTRADGGGKHYALASPVMVGQEDATLYAEWLPQTPADALIYDTVDGHAVVRGAARDIGDTLVIPPYLGGMAVSGVADGAFSGNGAIKTVLVPLGVTRIGSNAFSNCAGLSTLYLPDTIEAIDDGAFGTCLSLQHLRVLAGSDIHVYGREFEAALVDQYLRLITLPGKRLIIVAGSSGSLGLNSNLLAERYPDYEIVNFSGSYLFGIRPLLAYVSNNIHEGDVVIFAPEYYQGMYGNLSISGIANWMYLESNYTMLDELDLTKVRESILDTFAEFMNQRREIFPETQEPYGLYARSVFNEYGDVAVNRNHKREAEPFLPDAEIVNEISVQMYSDVFATITEKGGLCLFSFPPVSDAYAPREELTPAYDAFTQKVTQTFAGLPCTVISSAADYIFPAEQFYDNRYHMTSEGADARTLQLIADLDAYGFDR